MIPATDSSSHTTTHAFHLKGNHLLIGRALWAVAAVIGLVVTIASVRAFPAYLQAGSVGLTINCAAAEPAVQSVTAKGPADQAGVTSGERVLAINGQTITRDNCNAVVEANVGAIGSNMTFDLEAADGTAREITLTRSLARSDLLRALLAINQLPLEGAISVVVAFEVLALLIFWGLGFVVAWQRGDDALALFTSALLIVGGIRFSGLINAVLTPSVPNVLIVTYSIFLVLYFGIFPTGRFVPRWGAVLWLSYLVVALNWLTNLIPAANTVFSTVDIVFYFTVIAMQVYRYAHAISPSQRQQTKWVVYGFAAGVGGFFAFRITNLLGIALPPEIDVVGVVLSRFLILLAPLSLGFAVLRYRLFEIDLVINRSLTYGTVLALLASVFVAVMLLLQRVLGESNSGLAFAVSAVGAGILFNPARKRLQNIVDRRIYGFRFNLFELRHVQRLHQVKTPGVFTGRKLGGYQLLDVLGRGGMGEVYKATDGQREVAVKILPDIFAINDENRKRFEREADSLTALNHPNIVKMYHSGSSDGTYFMAMELIHGQQLDEVIAERGALAVEDVRDIMTDLAAALNYAHQQGLVHRDIKPSNVMLRLKPDNETFQAILMDFGIAKIHDAHTNLTGTGAVGTIDYMAPEQIMTSHEVDQRADIYALGILLYEMLTGQRPFQGGAGQVMFAHIQQPAPDPRDLVPDLPREFAKAVLKALEKQPEDRFQTAGELAASLG